MKYKIVPIGYHLVLEEQCLQYLHDLSIRGWKLKKVGLYFFIFEKCDSPLKYQIDYNVLDDEYVEITKAMGYTHIGNYYDCHFFYSEDLNAVDLQTDETVYKVSLLKRYSIGRIILAIVLAVLTYGFSTLPFQIVPLASTLGQFYIDFNFIILTSLFISLSIMLLIAALHDFVVRLYIQEKISETAYKQTRILHFISTFISFLSIVIALYLFLYIIQSLTGLLMMGLFMLIYWAFQHFNNKLVYKQKSVERTRLVHFGMAIVWIIIFLLFPSIPEVSTPYQTPYYSYTSENTSVDKNIFVIDSKISQDHFYERTYDCFNSSVAKEIMKSCIIQIEHTLRIPSPEESDKIAYETGHFSIYDIPFVSHEKAVQSLKRYQDQRVDECYYIGTSLIMRKDNIVIETYLDNEKNIDQIITHYFET